MFCIYLICWNVPPPHSDSFLSSTFVLSSHTVMASSKAGVNKGDLPSLISLTVIALQHLNGFPNTRVMASCPSFRWTKEADSLIFLGKGRCAAVILKEPTWPRTPCDSLADD